MEPLYSVHSDYQNKAVRLPEDIVARNRQSALLKHFMLASAGHRDSEQNIGHIVERYSPNEYVIIYCVNGKGWCRSGSKRWIVNPGDVMFGFRDTFHCYGADEGKPWAIYWSCFTGEDVSFILELLNITQENPIFHIGHKPNIAAAFLEILEILQRGYAIHHLIYASSCLQRILSTLSLYAKQQTYAEPVVESAVTMMINHIDGSVSLEQIASKVGLSVNYFTRIFMSKTGYTPVDYFIRLKIQKACTLLDTTTLNVREISYKLGYQDVYYFSRIFKKKVGHSPKEYRKRLTV